MKIAETKRLVLRNWEEKDRDLFHEINSDPQVMAHFPFRRTREQSDAFFDRLRGTIAETSLGFFAVAPRETDETLGFCGLSRPALEPHLPKGTVRSAGASRRATGARDTLRKPPSNSSASDLRRRA